MVDVDGEAGCDAEGDGHDVPDTIACLLSSDECSFK